MTELCAWLLETVKMAEKMTSSVVRWLEGSKGKQSCEVQKIV